MSAKRAQASRTCSQLSSTSNRCLVLSASDERLHERLARLLGHTQRLRHCLRHKGRIGKRSQFHKPCAIGIVLQHVGSHLQPKPGLAASAAAGQGQQPCLAEQ